MAAHRTKTRQVRTLICTHAQDYVRTYNISAPFPYTRMSTGESEIEETILSALPSHSA